MGRRHLATQGRSLRPGPETFDTKSRHPCSLLGLASRGLRLLGIALSEPTGISDLARATLVLRLADVS